MYHIIQIYTILKKLKLVESPDDFSTVFCRRHPKWLKDSRYHDYVPTMEVLLNIREMVKYIYDKDRTDGHLTDHERQLEKCLNFIDIAMLNYHQKTVNMLSVAINENLLYRSKDNEE